MREVGEDKNNTISEELSAEFQCGSRTVEPRYGIGDSPGTLMISVLANVWNAL